MNKFFLLLLVLLVTINARSQSLIDSLSNPSFTLQDTIAEKLAEVALTKNPNVKMMDKQVEASMYEWKSRKMPWLSNLTPSFNFNEGNIKQSDSAFQNLFYPRYNLNLSLPLSTFFSKPKETKMAKAEYESTIALKEAEVNKLKVQIKTAYQIYQANRYLLALQETVVQDESVLLSQVQKGFEENKITLEIFTVASKRYNSELVKKIGLLRDVNTSKNELEGLLGMSLETALALIRGK